MKKRLLYLFLIPLLLCLISCNEGNADQNNNYVIDNYNSEEPIVFQFPDKCFINDYEIDPENHKIILHISNSIIFETGKDHDNIPIKRNQTIKISLYLDIGDGKYELTSIIPVYINNADVDTIEVEYLKPYTKDQLIVVFDSNEKIFETPIQ